MFLCVSFFVFVERVWQVWKKSSNKTRDCCVPMCCGVVFFVVIEIGFWLNIFFCVLFFFFVCYFSFLCIILFLCVLS